MFDGDFAESLSSYRANTKTAQQKREEANGCAAWNAGNGCRECDAMYGMKTM